MEKLPHRRPHLSLNLQSFQSSLIKYLNQTLHVKQVFMKNKVWFDTVSHITFGFKKKFRPIANLISFLKDNPSEIVIYIEPHSSELNKY